MRSNLTLALEIAAEHGLYAYDAYLITCALGQRAPLLTLAVYPNWSATFG